MTSDELWKIFVAKNPALEGEGECTMSKDNVKKFFLKSFQGGYDHGYVQGKAMGEAGKIGKKPSYDPMDIFSDILGRKEKP